jgi:MOSC domain-containing protein YiiM
MTHLTTEQLVAGLEAIRQSPRDHGTVRLIVKRPAVDVRERTEACQLDTAVGLVGDNWQARGSRHTPDGSAEPDAQLTIMNARAAQLIAGEIERWPLAGDQLYIDLDLGLENLPPGTQLTIGTAAVEITALPHTGCKKFVARFGVDAMKFVNSPTGRSLNLRGVNARVIRNGTVRVGDRATKSSGEPSGPER